jgi:hypothetical protein
VDKRQVAQSWVLVAAVVFAALAACSEDTPTPAPAPSHQWGKGVYIGPEFTLARAVTGHRVHVVSQKIECTKCHTPTETSIGPPVKPERCASCHEKEAKLQHATKEAERRFGAGVKADCTTCHAFKFEGSNKEKEEAQQKAEALREPEDGGTGPKAMHGIEQFAPGDCKHCHEKQQGETPAVVSHLTEKCLACHKPHDDPVPKSAPCADCHKDIATTHASESKSASQVCTTCHQNQHEPAEAALPTCVECHSKEQPIIPATALFAKGHDACTSCHKPHDFDAKKAAACSSCHEGKAVLGGGRIAAHNACSNCHTPHNVRASPGAACGNCHKNLQPTHPKHAGSACTGCHDAHPAGAGAAVASECSSCHQKAHSDTDFHRGVACEACHKPHGFKLEVASTSMCSACHAQRVSQVRANAGHQACTQCHQGLPHHPEPNEVGCEKCHAAEHSRVMRGHARCTQCHEPHSGAQTSACGNCHKEEHRTAPAGHQACANCHEPHGGKSQKACTTCHADQAKTAHGALASGCLSCHRPHGPSGPGGPPGVAASPACTSCHKIGTLPGLHAETKHQSCTTCHSGHGELPGTARQACLNCHKDRTEHFPNAARCASCHLFTPPR